MWTASTWTHGKPRTADWCYGVAQSAFVPLAHLKSTAAPNNTMWAAQYTNPILSYPIASYRIISLSTTGFENRFIPRINHESPDMRIGLSYQLKWSGFPLFTRRENEDEEEGAKQGTEWNGTTSIDV
ncbi:hypothetical protein C8J57DRAFT_1232310 [Mycena rebaudengoi]|nr:hypothetical protein C8J57DRAFT_1232310 [Mycena rebaudengoi]